MHAFLTLALTHVSRGNILYDRSESGLCDSRYVLRRFHAVVTLDASVIACVCVWVVGGVLYASARAEGTVSRRYDFSSISS